METSYLSLGDKNGKDTHISFYLYLVKGWNNYYLCLCDYWLNNNMYRAESGYVTTEYTDVMTTYVKCENKYCRTVCENFNCPIYVITGEGDQVIEKERLDNWNKYTNGKVSYMTFPGDHYYLAHEAQALCNLMKDFYEESVEISE